MSAKRQALGKGLNALLSENSTDLMGRKTVPVNSISEISISDIEANPFQPRESFEEESLDELTESINIHGLIQPVTVRKIGNGKYQLISGERRTRAAIRAGLKTIPAYVRVANDQSMLEMSLVENLHRDDLNPVEVALSYRRLVEECNLKQEELAGRVGKKRATVTNYLRLLKLPEEIQLALKKNQITMGHARSIINISDPKLQLSLFRRIIENGLSVRDIEEISREAKNETVHYKPRKLSNLQKPEYFTLYERKFSIVYGTKVKIKPKSNGRGEIVIPFDSEEKLNQIVRLLES